jgi:plastocyanin
MPGDLAGGALSRPPVVQQGQPLQFGNFDASASILHTVTACRLPCNRSTGVSYPLANGPGQFDSAQLGYGPPGLTAASDRVDWRTPAGLRPGTYTYFCRVHPFMRGAFRVRRAH